MKGRYEIMKTKEFIEKLNQGAEGNNAELIEKIQEVGKNPEAVYTIAKEAGLTDSFEDFQAEMKIVYDSMAEGLSEEELVAIAGGLSKEDAIFDVVGGVGIVVIIAGAAWAA